MVQMRRLLHQTMPGYDDLFDDDKLFHKSIGLPIAMEFSSAEAIRRAGVVGIENHLRKAKVRFQTRTIERIVAWAAFAAEPSELARIHTRQWQQLNEVRRLLGEQITATGVSDDGRFPRQNAVYVLPAHRKWHQRRLGARG